jgi:hypothetical protein
LKQRGANEKHQQRFCSELDKKPFGNGQALRWRSTREEFGDKYAIDRSNCRILYAKRYALCKPVRFSGRSHSPFSANSSNCAGFPMNESPLLVLDGADVSSLLSHFSPSFRRRWQPIFILSVISIVRA